LVALIDGYCFAVWAFEANATIGELGLWFPAPRVLMSRGDQDLRMNEIFLAFGTFEHPVGHTCFRALALVNKTKSVEFRVTGSLYWVFGRNEGESLEERVQLNWATDWATASYDTLPTSIPEFTRAIREPRIRPF
jgi:hypothetical protein